MKKCGNDSARAGESNATFTGWIDPLLTQSLSILSPRGCSSKTSHTHTQGCDFCQNRSTVENQQKFRKMWKNVHSTQRTGTSRLVSIFHFGCLFGSTPPPATTGADSIHSARSGCVSAATLRK